MKSYYFEIEMLNGELNKYVAQGKNKNLTYSSILSAYGLNIDDIKSVAYRIIK